MTSNLKKIMIVDDDVTLLDLLKEALENEGYIVKAADNPFQALEQLKQNKYHMLITDLSMPGMSGLELTERVSKIYPDIPIVLLTAQGRVDIAIDSLQKGASDYITKPFNIKELPIVIERNLERRRLETEKLKERREQVLFEAIKALAAAIDAKDHYTAGHSQRVTEYSLKIANRSNFSVDECYLLQLAASMHDLGKIGVPDLILNKPDKLTPEEWNYVISHPIKGGDIIGEIEELAEIASVIRHHHENYDGTGYPDGLKGEAIPLLSRIIAVADAYEAMTSDRAYRDKFTFEKAIEELKIRSGTQFDPNIVKAFVESISE